MDSRNYDANGKSGGTGPLPERWLNCPRKSCGLLANKFLAFKTPLDSKFDDQVPLSCRFTPGMLLTSLKSHKVKLGLWIDLTKTSRFYNKDEVENAGCSYVKIQCEGHGSAPTVEQTNTFITLCNNFIVHHPLDVIGVHCTHGYNRTGFLLISFLVENMDCSIEAALHEFGKIRPPGIYKQDYIKELYRRYDDEKDAPLAPMLPSWCFDQNSNDDNYQNGTSNHKFGNKRLKKYKDNPIFMEGVPGVEPVTDQKAIDKIHEKMNELCNGEYSHFPGSQPVSMTKSNIHFLSMKPYQVSWKADGTRYMLLIRDKDEIYFIDRDNSVFKVNKLQFFHRKSGQHLTNTLLDGEMVIDVYKDKKFPRYLIYDIVNFENNRIGDQPFYPIRLNAIKVEIIDPRIEAMKEGRIVKEKEPFSVRHKSFYNIMQSSYLLGEKFARQLTHDPDGLIFQPSDDPYTCGQSNRVLKWKPLSMNSIDFLLEVKKETREGYANQFVGNLYTGKKTYFAEIKCTKAVRALNGKIIECSFKNNQWVLMRERTDKSFPNSYETAKAVLSSIREPITKEILLNYIEHNRWKEPMPPPLAPPPIRKTKR